jgi:hypothetical protein
MGALRLVRPDTQDAIALNRQRIASYIAKLIRSEFDQSVWEPFFTAVRFLEVWYWFDSINLSHTIAIVGEDSKTSPDPQMAATTAHYATPILLFSVLRARGNCSDVEAAERGRVFKIEMRAVSGHEFDQVDREAQIADWLTEDARLIFRIATISDTVGIKELTESQEYSPIGEEWSALLVLVTSFNRIPAVPIAKAAKLLQIEEKTVRNRIERKELEAIPRSGTIWVTLRSIKHYLKTHYHATATFDLWSEVESTLKGKKGNLGRPGNP